MLYKHNMISDNVHEAKCGQVRPELCWEILRILSTSSDFPGVIDPSFSLLPSTSVSFCYLLEAVKTFLRFLNTLYI
jgi:hypothetical protein